MLFKEKLASLCQWLKKKSFVICCGIAPVILLSALLVTCDFGCNVIVNGEVIGTAPSKEYVQNLIDSINTSLSPYMDGSDAIIVEPVMTPKLIVGKGFTDPQVLGERLKSYCPYLEKAYTVKSNGSTVAAFTTSRERQNVYDKFIRDITANSTSYEILDEISFEYELVPYGLIKSGDSARKMLSRKYTFSDVVSVNSDCKLQDILCAYSIGKKEFYSLNPGFTEGEGTTVKIKSEIPYIRVVTKENYTENTVLKHSVKYENDDTMYVGQSKTKLEGTDGFVKTDKTRYGVNGVKLLEVSEQTTTEEAVSHIVLLGTKELPKGESAGSIINPYDGLLTSRFGNRDGRNHKGIDISGEENSDIKAADGGKIVFAGWDNSGYGNMIKIDHPSGYTTVYAHCNKLYVSEGEEVCQGQVIAALGNTGRSTGAHVHFEVWKTDANVPVDPLDFFQLNEQK